MTVRKTLHAVLGPRSALLIASDVPEDIVGAAMRAVLEGSPVSVLMAALTDRGLAGTPDFACVVQDESATRLVVRGPYVARVGGVDGEEVSGEGVATWLERLLPADAAVELMSGDHLVHVPARDPDFALADDSVPVEVIAPLLERAAAEPPAPLHAADPKAALTPAVPLEAHTEATWHTTPSSPPELIPGATPTPAADDTDHDADPFRHMLEHTMHFGVEAAAVRAVDEAPEPTAAPAPLPPPPLAATPLPLPQPAPAAATGGSGLIEMIPPMGGGTPPPPLPAPAPIAASGAEPDAGLTISRAEMMKLAGQVAAPNGNGAPKLQAVHCPMGHSSAPTDEMCRSCGSRLVDRSVTWVARPILARLTFFDGFVHAVHRPVLMGRAPTAESYTGGEEPQLLPLPDPEQMLSRTHAEIRLIDWQVQIIDRGSLNGTVVTLPGREPQQLRPREPFLLSRGAQVALGGVVTFTYQESES